MAKKDELSQKLVEIVDNANKRNYIHRDFSLSITADLDHLENNTWKVTGNLLIGANEHEGTATTCPFAVEASGPDLRSLMEDVLVNLNYFPQKFGDAIFEKEFFALIREIESLEDDKADTSNVVLVN